MKLNFSLPEKLMLKSSVGIEVPKSYCAYQLLYPEVNRFVLKGAWGILLYQQLQLGQHVYCELYYETNTDMPIEIAVNERLTFLYGRYNENIIVTGPFGAKTVSAGKLSMHSLAPGTKYHVKPRAGAKYHSFYIFPHPSLLKTFHQAYGTLDGIINSMDPQASCYVSLPEKKLTVSYQKELEVLKHPHLVGEPGIIVAESRINVLVMNYLADISKASLSQTYIIEEKDKAIDLLLAEIDTLPALSSPVAETAKELKIPVHLLELAVKRKTGKTLAEYIKDSKLKKSKELLYNTEWSIRKVANTVGYSDPHYFSRLFKKTYNMTPNLFRMGFLPDNAPSPQ